MVVSIGRLNCLHPAIQLLYLFLARKIKVIVQHLHNVITGLSTGIVAWGYTVLTIMFNYLTITGHPLQFNSGGAGLLLSGASFR